MGPRALPITDDIFQVGGPGFTAPQDSLVYLVVSDGRAALIDSGCGRDTDLLLANIEAAGVDPRAVELLLLTHCHYDHSGGAAELRKRLGCRVVAHCLEAVFIEEGNNNITAANWYMGTLTPCVVDRRLAHSREEIPLGRRSISAIHIPGHSPGSVAYLVESGGRRVLFAQDVHGPLRPALLSNPDDYYVSLQRLLDLNADILCEGHLGIFEGRESVAAFVRSFLVGQHPEAGAPPGAANGPA
ncbi:MAG TPA: MBL fold metallo-hydrolase [Burkholderiales bacterium]|nr:MBL fold metallo-hydrolase [Burkholderiales bacterium]